MAGQWQKVAQHSTAQRAAQIQLSFRKFFVRRNDGLLNVVNPLVLLDQVQVQVQVGEHIQISEAEAGSQRATVMARSECQNASSLLAFAFIVHAV